MVDHSNLQRQVIHGTSWVGKPKIESAKARILEINPHCQVDLYETALTSDNALEIIGGYDIVCDGTEAADRRIERVLWNDPATGVMRHADAGYPDAIACAREHGLNLPMITGGGAG